MTEQRDFLVELGTEELPPKALRRLSDAFADDVTRQIEELGLSYAKVKRYASPRRLAVLVEKLDSAQAEQVVERRGPPVKVAYDADGKPTKAAEKFAQSCNISVDDIQTTSTDKGEWLYFKGVEPGKQTDSLLADIVQQSLARLPIPKRMRWGDSDIEFVRPVHWAVMLWGRDVIPCELIGMASGSKTYGHRFHAPEAIELGEPREYVTRLKEEGWVIADYDERKQLVAEMVEAAAKQCGGVVVSDDDLLEEICSLVEWPVPVGGEYNQRFLQLPPEVLISTLKDHQRYFPVVDKDNPKNILPWFVTISNIKSQRPEEVKKGNERVVEPRLADAEFFWNADKKMSLEDRIQRLGNVVFQKKLGSLADKTDRISRGAVTIANMLGTDTNKVKRAASICKCDLITDMVGEFPDLQGTMGRYYATHDKEDSEVAQAMEEQYMPRFANDALPATSTGVALALADRIDTIVSIFAIGKKPTGTKDPFGLRRAALGVLRSMMELELDLNLKKLIEAAAESVMPLFRDDKKPAYANAQALTDDVFNYMLERLRSYFLDDQSTHYTPGMFAAVMSSAPEQPLDFLHRMQAVSAFMSLDESASLAAANKRIANILRSAKDSIPAAPSADRLKEAAEIELYKSLEKVSKKVASLQKAGNYKEALTLLAGLRTPVDNFFDNVMVMDEDEDLRTNRLALLSSLRNLFLHTADFSKIQ